MPTRQENEDYLAHMRAMRDTAEVICATTNYTSQDWDDLNFFRAECRRVEADLAALPSSTAAAPRERTATSAQLGRPVTQETMKELDAVYRRAARSQGHTARSIAGLPVMNALSALALIPSQLLPADVVRRLLPGRSR